MRLLPFPEILGPLQETIALVGERGTGDISHAMERGRGNVVIAVGFGASAAVAEYFAHCRATLGLGTTVVMTPVRIILSSEDWSSADIWIFSAGDADDDIAAALEFAASSGSERVWLVTASPDGAPAIAAKVSHRCDLLVLPIATAKSPALAIQAMISMVAGLLIASDGNTERPHGRALMEALQTGSEAALRNQLIEGFRIGDTLVVVQDPHARAVGTLLETFLWQTGLAPVQLTDFRSFARGSLLRDESRSRRIFALALTTRESEPVWRSIDALLPEFVRRGVMDLDHGGRLANAIGIVSGLVVVARLCELSDTCLSIGDREASAAIVEDDAMLRRLVDQRTPAVRHKTAARLLHDSVSNLHVALSAFGRERMHNLGQARFVGIVLDYDGTVVPNEPPEARLGPPAAELIGELVRLAERGVRIGFATGRGGSAGDRLREALPDRFHDRVLVGYFNGAHVRPLAVDIRHDRPPVDASVAATAAWITRSGLLSDDDFLASEVQVTISIDEVGDPTTFRARLLACPEIAAGRVRLLSSQHSFDIVPGGATKLAVARELVGGGNTDLVLAVGDSGSPLGNDRELLSGPHSVSVGSVCGDHQGAWTLFGLTPRGPDALLRLLMAAHVGDDGMRIDRAALSLDHIQ